MMFASAIQYIHVHVHSGRVPRMMVKFNLEISESLSKVFKSKNSHATRAYKIHSMHVNNFALTLKKRTKMVTQNVALGNG